MSPEVVTSAIADAQGNLTRAAEALQISKRHLFRLARRHGLGEMAAQMRIDAGQRARGRPRRQ